MNSGSRFKLFSKRRFSRGKLELRDFVLKYARFLGLQFADTLVALGYLIKNSHEFRSLDVNFFESRFELYDEIADNLRLDAHEVSYLEFGVYEGSSFKYWLEKLSNPGSTFHGFDTFTGLPEDWGHIPQGHFSTEGRLPTINDDRCFFHVGLFQETLPSFLRDRADLFANVLVVHMDADLYSSTLYVLTELSQYLKAGDILIFDEFFSVVNSATEFRAYLDFRSTSSREFRFLAKTSSQCALQIV